MCNERVCMSATTPTQNQKVFRVEALDQAVTLRRLRAIDKIEVGLQQSLLVRGAVITALNAEAQDVSYMLAMLKVALVEPRDFPFDELDSEDLIELWRGWNEFNQSFRKPKSEPVEPTRG